MSSCIILLTRPIRKRGDTPSVMMCRIGNGVSYCDGVSPRGREYYDQLLSKLGDKYSPFAISALVHYEIQTKLSNRTCLLQAKLALSVIRQSVINERLIECFDYLLERIETTGKCVFESQFKSLAAPSVNVTRP